MQILSNFDTQYRRKMLADYVDKYGSDNVLLIQRSILFATIFVYIPVLIYILVAGFTFYFLYFLLDVDFIIWLIRVLLIFFLVFVLSRTIKKYIDYILDFGIVTPKGVSIFNQTGILNRNSTYLNVKNIRTITVSQKGLAYSLFNNGDIIILSEGTDNQLGEIIMSYVYDPEEKRERIRDIFAISNPRNY